MHRYRMGGRSRGSLPLARSSEYCQTLGHVFDCQSLGTCGITGTKSRSTWRRLRMLLVKRFSSMPSARNTSSVATVCLNGTGASSIIISCPLLRVRCTTSKLGFFGCKLLAYGKIDETRTLATPCCLLPKMIYQTWMALDSSSSNS
jgi:hypothetical protein